jgi:hypothetical protein
VEYVFPDAEIVQAGSVAQAQKAFGPDGAKAKSAAEVRQVLPKNFDSDFRRALLEV